MATLRNIDTPERGVLLLDKDFRVTFANRRASEIFGIALDDLIGNGLPDMITHRDIGDDEVVEEVLESIFGWDVTFHRYSTPLFTSEREVSGRVEIYSDITARRGLEKEILDRNMELAELNTQLEEAQEQLVQSERLRALGEMAAGVAHDINNVLGIILGNAQLARRRLDKTSDAFRSIEAIELAARDGAETVRRLREIGKPIDRSTYSSVDLSEIVSDVVRSAVPAWRESGANNGADIEVVTGLAADCFVLGNASELREALANVLLNAIQAIDNSGKITISTAVGSHTAEMRIKDNGIGMCEETRARIFDPFFTTRGAQGTGLGMSMVDAIAIRHGGKVVIDSAVGAGTEICLRFPRLVES